MPSRYTDQSLLRSSHFGDLYRATESETGAEVVLRRLFDAETASIDPERVRTLESSTARLTGLRHPNVAPILDGGADTYGGYIVSDLIEGNDLTSIVSQAALTPEDFATVARHTLDGLVAIHEHKLIHGSLRPNRIVVNWDDDQNLRFVITDLGLAELLESADIVTSDENGHYNGILDAMAPELFEGQPGNAQSDLYSLGNIYYYALTQKLPFAADTADATIDRHYSGEVVHLTAVREDVPSPLADWVMSLISRNPEDRPLTAAVARESLERALLGEAPLETEAIAAAAPSPSPSSESPDLMSDAVSEPADETEPQEVNETGTDTAVAKDPESPAEPEPASESDHSEEAVSSETAEDQDQSADPVVVVEADEPTAEQAITPATAKVTVSAVQNISVADQDDAGPVTKAPRTTPRKASGWIPPTVGGLVAVGLGAFAWFEFIAPPKDDTTSTDGPAKPAGTAATPAPLPEASNPDPTSAAAAPPESTSGIPFTKGLLARFAFDEIADSPGATVVGEWPKQEGLAGIGALRAQGVNSTTGSQIRKIAATPTMFPALNRGHSLLQITGQASLNVQWRREGEGFLTGDQLTCTVVFWTPEKNATLYRIYPPITSEAEISARIVDKQLLSNINFGGREFPIIPFPHGNQLIALTLTWTGPQDSVMQSVMTASGDRYNSKLAAAPNLALLLSSLSLGGDTGPLTETRPSGIYIAELILYDRALSERERALLDNYLNRKYFR